MTGQVILGGLAVFLMFWFGLSAIASIGHAFPFRPTLVLPGRSRSASLILIWMIVLAAAAAPFFGGVTWMAFIPFVMVLALPIWDLMTASGFRDSLVVVNGQNEGVRPALVGALTTFLGELETEGDTYRSQEHREEAIQIDVIPERGLVIISPHFVIPPKRRQELEHLVKEALKPLPAGGFNLMVFGAAVVLPFAIAVAFGWMGVMLFSSLV